MTYIWRSLLLALAVLLIIAGCGQDNSDEGANGSFVEGANSDVVAVRVVGNFPAAVTQFRVSVLSASAQLLGQQTVARNGSETNVQISGIPRGSAIVRVEALTADNAGQSFYQVPVTVPLAEGVLVAPSSSFVVGPAPSPTPIPSPGVSPATSPATASPSPSPGPSPSTSQSPIPGGSPTGSPSGTASPSPGGTASPSPGGTASPSPIGSPTGAASPSPLGSPTGAASPSPLGSPTGAASPSPLGSPAGVASPSPR